VREDGRCVRDGAEEDEFEAGHDGCEEPSRGLLDRNLHKQSATDIKNITPNLELNYRFLGLFFFWGVNFTRMRFMKVEQHNPAECQQA
jgi:hypothetical protein